MLFNSIEFALFLPIVFVIYWCINTKEVRLQNCFLILASYLFYGWWDWRFLILIVFSSLVDYTIGIALSNTNQQRTRKQLLLTSIFVNIGLLLFFKYFNFFIQSFADTFTLLGKPIETNRLNIILPVGISFYTFQTLSYTIDVYQRKVPATKDIFSLFAYVSFFPQLVAGPIERATNLLPQFYKKRTFEYDKAADGLRQILWGLFKKIVIADNCALLVNYTFENYADLNGSTLLLGAVFFAFQIYGDFSGYSDIAIGTARLFGFNLMQNFKFPYFSRDVAEFWRRWHISLSTWFRDYVYIPLGGSRGTTRKQIQNVFIIFLISGFWHGNNWTFLAWGFLNACYFLPLLLLKKNRKHLEIVAKGSLFPSVKELAQIAFTFSITVFAWIFFRAATMNDAFHYISTMLSSSLFEIPNTPNLKTGTSIFLFIAICICIEWLGREQQYAIEKLGITWKPIFRYALYYAIIFSIFWFGGEQQEFIYFQF